MLIIYGFIILTRFMMPFNVEFVLNSGWSSIIINIIRKPFKPIPQMIISYGKYRIS